MLARTLDPSKLGDDSLVIGTATDPYQPAERHFRLTRRILEVLTAFHGLAIGIITKSPLVTRDIDVLQALSPAHEVRSTSRSPPRVPRLARRLELRSPVPSARLRALRGSLRPASAGLLIAPIIPGVTDDCAGLLGSWRRRRRRAPATWSGRRSGSVPRRGTASFPTSTREFPELAERYRNHYGGREGVSREYQEALTRRLDRLQQELGFPVDEERHRRAHLDGRRAEAARVAEQPALL